MAYEITKIDSSRVAANDTSGDLAVAAMVVVGDSPRIFHRRATRLSGGDQAAVSWLVGELAGVRCYFDGVSIVLTKEDLYP